MKHFHFFFLLLLTVGFLFPISAICQWSLDPNVNTAISTAVNEQFNVAMVSDGAGGAIITWQDDRNTPGYYDIYAQRINSAGIVQWTTDGVAISTETNHQAYPAITSDGAGGAIIVWQDFRSDDFDIYAQHISNTGVIQWAWEPNGVLVVSAQNDQVFPKIVSDGAGGAIMTWSDGRNGSWDVYSQRINSAGTTQWTPSGVPIATGLSAQWYPAIVTTSTGDVIIAWQDARNGNYDIYAQRIDGSGSALWLANGVVVSAAVDMQTDAVLVSDETGGAVIAWNDFRSGTSYDIFAQGISSSGVVKWTADGVAISTVAGSAQINPVIESDGVGGAIMAWTDSRNVTYDVYAQRISSSGSVQWTADGYAICVEANNQQNPVILSDGEGNVFISWEDYRSGTNYDIYAQHLNNSGTMQWTWGGIPISSAFANQAYARLIKDGSDGVILAWMDGRDLTWNIYAQNVDKFGFFGFANPTLKNVQDVAGDQGGKVTVAWDRSYLDVYPEQTITYYSVWRGIDMSALAKGVTFVSPSDIQKDYQNNAYMVTHTTTGDTYWEWLANVPSAYFSKYSYTASTLSDSSSSGTPYFKFQVLAHTSNQFNFWNSNVDSGYSVDNLSPTFVTELSAILQSGPSVDVSWKENTSDPDVNFYEIHRSTADGFLPDAGTKIGETSDALFNDANPLVGFNNFYRVITVDIHNNKSVPSQQALAATMSTSVVSMNDKWNMVSVPLTMNDYNKTSLFPTSVSNAFAYEGGYVAYSTLTNGKGYWMKFNGSQSVSLSGFVRSTETVSVTEGWNMLGSISSSIPVAQVSSNPPGMVTSQFFGYDNGYTASSTIEPGMAYWVKVNASGTLALSSVVSNQSTVNKITIVPTNELPPPPPETNSNNSIMPGEFALEQNYPNPFNPSTVISYQLPVESWVTLKVYNVLGEEVTTIVNEFQATGFKSAQWDASTLSSGIYTYRLTAAPNGGQAGTFTETKKMIYLR